MNTFLAFYQNLGPALTLLVIGTFLLAGTVKGVIGLGLNIAAYMAGQPTLPLELEVLHWTALCLVALQSYCCYLLVSRLLPAHLFVSIFVSSFLNSLLGALCFVACLAVGYFAVLGLGTDTQPSEFLLVMPLLAMPEALLNGMAMTLLLVYRPHWVAAFRQE